MDLSNKLISAARPLCNRARIRDIRIGLGYTCVELSDGRAGLAATPRLEPHGSCTKLRSAGTLLGMQADELLEDLACSIPLQRAVALAVCNALNMEVQREYIRKEALELLGIQEADHVVMVGHFAPLVPRIKACGCRLDIVEQDPAKPGITDPEQGLVLLAQCDVAVITSTSIINSTADQLLGRLQKARQAVMLGPSTPLFPEAFAGTGITQLSGSRLLDSESVKNIVSQGGGTMLLKKHLEFVSLPIS